MDNSVVRRSTQITIPRTDTVRTETATRRQIENGPKRAIAHKIKRAIINVVSKGSITSCFYFTKCIRSQSVPSLSRLQMVSTPSTDAGDTSGTWAILAISVSSFFPDLFLFINTTNATMPATTMTPIAAPTITRMKSSKDP